MSQWENIDKSCFIFYKIISIFIYYYTSELVQYFLLKSIYNYID